MAASCGGDDCNDASPNVHPGATEVCGDSVDQDCAGGDAACPICPDADHDGDAAAWCGGDDCDDVHGNIHPGAAEVCGDTVDQDCVGGDTACAVCAEGAVPAYRCVCDGIARASGYCCSGLWQATSCGSVAILWTDSIQAGVSSWGFNGLGVEHPVGTTVPPNNDANGASLTVVPNPLPGGGNALRHFATFDNGGSRAQAGIYSFANAAFGTQAKSVEGIYVAQEWYFPSAIGAGGDPYPWISVWDWHSTDPGGANRWHTSPGLMLHEDGSMRVRWEWGGGAGSINSTSADSSIAMPVGEWFDIEMYYVWTDSRTATLRWWINGQLALEQSGVQTRTASHQNVEMYTKWYGSRNNGIAWSPDPGIRYTRNVRISATRIGGH